MWNDYFVPATLEEALGLLARYGQDARIIAGGTDLVIELDRGTRHAGTLIDISRLNDQDRICLDGEDRIHLGPLTTHNQVVASHLCVERAYPLARACREVGAPQIRNRATVAGNLITASPANDTITPLMALGARVTLRSTRGERQVSLGNFYLGVRRTVIAPDEMLTDIAFPALRSDQHGTFIKLGLRRAQAISVVNCAVIHTAGARSSITLGAVAPTIIHASEAETALAGQRLNPELIDRVAQLASTAATPIDDVRSTASYRRRMVGVIVRRALTQLMNGSARADWGAGPVLLQYPARQCNAGQKTAPVPAHSFAVAPIQLTVNGRTFAIEGASDKTLLRLLREDCGLTGTKEGCAEGECGACTVIMDGVAVMACLVPAPRAHGTVITTIEGLSQDGQLHPLQQAFVDEGAVQCGYCSPGFLMSGAALLQEYRHPTAAQIKEGISGNLCRCTGYYKILSAFERVARSTVNV